MLKPVAAVAGDVVEVGHPPTKRQAYPRADVVALDSVTGGRCRWSTGGISPGSDTGGSFQEISGGQRQRARQSGSSRERTPVPAAQRRDSRRDCSAPSPPAVAKRPYPSRGTSSSRL